MAIISDALEHTILFDDEINYENTQNLIDKMSNYQFVNLYFSTNGGSLAYMIGLIDYLNRRYAQGTLRVNLQEDCCSAGTLLLTSYQGPIFISESFTFFMFHLPDRQTLSHRKLEYEVGALRVLQNYNTKYAAKLKQLGLNKSELIKFNKGEDVYIYRDQIARLNANLVEDENLSESITYTKIT